MNGASDLRMKQLISEIDLLNKERDKEVEDFAKFSKRHRIPKMKPVILERYVEEDEPMLYEQKDDENEELILDDVADYKFESNDRDDNSSKDKQSNYCLPRTNYCVSEQYITLMNYFCETGGLHNIMRAIVVRDRRNKKTESIRFKDINQA